MTKILYEIDTDNLFANTTAAQDKEVLKEFLSQMTDDMLVEEVVERGLLLMFSVSQKRPNSKQSLMSGLMILDTLN